MTWAWQAPRSSFTQRFPVSDAAPVASRLQAAWLHRGGLACVLLPLAVLYGAVTRLRAALYRLGIKRSHRLPVPVIVVGNLVAGGAGKTPTTIALVSDLRRRGWQPGIISRGYGRLDRQTRLVDRHTPAQLAGDEPLLMHLRTGAPVAVGADRIAAATTLLQAQPSIDVLISDDGLQHLRLTRDAQVIVFDERGAGNGWLLPSGPLRERLPAKVPQRSVVLYNAASPSTPLPGHLASRSLGGVVELKAWWAGEPGRLEAMQALRGRSLVAVAGLAHPQRFFNMLRDAGLSIDELALPDHHDYAALPWPTGAADVVVTEKDAVKLDPAGVGNTRVWVATLDFALPAALLDQLMSWLPRAGRP